MRDRLEEFRKHRERMNAKILGSEHLGIKRFFALDTQAYADGAAQAAAPPPPPAPAAAPAAGDDAIAQLQQLADLKAQGILTDAEFAAQKAKILGS